MLHTRTLLTRIKNRKPTSGSHMQNISNRNPCLHSQFAVSIRNIVTIGYVAARTFFRKYNLISIRNLFPEVYNKSARFTYKDKNHCFRRRLNSDGSTDRSMCNCFFASSIPTHIGIRLISWWQISA